MNQISNYRTEFKILQTTKEKHIYAVGLAESEMTTKVDG